MYGVPKLLTQEKVKILKIGTEFKQNDPLCDNPLWNIMNPEGVPMGDSKMGDFRIPHHEDGGQDYPVDRRTDHTVSTRELTLFDCSGTNVLARVDMEYLIRTSSLPHIG